MAQDKPRLSILMAAYNCDAYVGDAIRSLLLQTYQRLEILICDDCSTDNTASIIETFSDPRIIFFRNEINIGKNKTCARLLNYAKGDYVSVHDADDISLPQRFEKQMTFLITHPEYVMCGTNFVSFLENGYVIGRSSLISDPAEISKRITRESQFHGPTVVFRKDILSRVGGFYRYFTRGEDIDLTMRIAEKFITTNLKEHLYLYRHVSTSLTNDVDSYSIERWGHVKLLPYLSEERLKNNGVDSLMRGDFEQINRMMEQFTAEYRHDPTIALRRGVFRLLGMQMYGNAIRLSFKALHQKINMLNIKCVVYALLIAGKGIFTLLRKREKIDLAFLQQQSIRKVA